MTRLQDDGDRVVMASRGMGSMKNRVPGSVAAQVIHAADVPDTRVGQRYCRYE